MLALALSASALTARAQQFGLKTNLLCLSRRGQEQGRGGKDQADR